MDRDTTAGEPGRWRTAGERIESLLDASSAGGTQARERAEQLVREVAGLYGAGLDRILTILADSGCAATVDELAADELVAGLLLIHGLHPHTVEARVRGALDRVRPYLGSHGGDVELLGVVDGVVRLRLTGSCHGCPSSSVTLELAVKDAVESAAPEVTAIETDGTEPAPTAGLISAQSLFSHVHSAAPIVDGTWLAAPELGDLAAGELGGFRCGGLSVLVCRLGADLLAYRDRCPVCTNSMAGAVLQRRAGGAAADAVLRCPTCRTPYDVRRAGARTDGGTEFLEPLPVLVRDGVLSIAIPATEAAG
ncbi:NifU family protein [Rhodococcus sp. NPDC127528]|uniref:NifU family protein n=1 Tax=unclassified Rhodococcus (in: high G+C Gram-positive bacteria) TaxID=192944 RepID=UPI0036410F65